MAVSRINSDLDVKGALSSDSMTIPDNSLTADSQVKAGFNLTRAKNAQETMNPFPLLLLDAIVWDSGAKIPLSTAANDDLWFNMGAVGSAEAPTIETEDKASNGAVQTQKAAWLFPISIEYDSDETFEIRVRVRMKTIADVSQTVDLNVYECTDGAVGADICATAAQTLTATYASYDFTITDTNLVAGDVLLIIMSVAVRDNATGSAVYAEISDVRVRCDTRG